MEPRCAVQRATTVVRRQARGIDAVDGRRRCALRAAERVSERRDVCVAVGRRKSEPSAGFAVTQQEPESESFVRGDRAGLGLAAAGRVGVGTGGRRPRSVARDGDDSTRRHHAPSRSRIDDGAFETFARLFVFLIRVHVPPLFHDWPPCLRRRRQVASDLDAADCTRAGENGQDNSGA